MRWLGGLVLAAWLAAAPVWGKDDACGEAGRLETSGFHLLAPAEDAMGTRLLAMPEEKSPRKGTDGSGVEFKADDDLLSLVFSTPTIFRPWVGGGLDLAGLENLDRLQNLLIAPPAYRLGAGLHCELGEDLRLNLGYRFSADSSSPAEDPFGEELPEEGVRHRFSFGLQKTF